MKSSVDNGINIFGILLFRTMVEKEIDNFERKSLEIEEVRIFYWFFFLLGDKPVNQRNEIIKSVCEYEIITIYREENEDVNNLKT